MIRKLVRSCVNIVFTLLVVLASGVFGSQAEAVTYYISPSGSDSNSGISSTSPWQTFGFAIPRLRPGDTLILRDGTYNASTSGYLNVACGTNAVNGTASQPLTIRAENERQAFISSNGTTNPVIIRNCSYWKMEGLRISTADNPVHTSVAGGNVLLYNMSNFTFRRNLLQYNNRYQNGSPITTETAMVNSLIEENEVYDFHRNGLSLAMFSNNNIVRRNYSNSRWRLDIAGGYPSGGPGGDNGFSCYPCSNNIFENNIAENSQLGFEVIAQGASNGNRYYGNIALNNTRGWGSGARGDTDAMMPHSNYLKDFVAVGSSQWGVSSVSSKDTRCDNCTLINNGGGLRSEGDTNVGYRGDQVYSLFGINVLALNNNTNSNLNNGLYINTALGTVTLGIDYMNSFGQASNFSPATSNPAITNAMTIDPKLGTCRVWIPDNSPMKRVGKNGADIGANILYRYENGVLTNQPLWNPSTGEFPGGAIVAGVNDIAGSSRFDVHKRLNVNTNGCSFPAGYAAGTTVPPLTGPAGHWKFDEGSGTSVSDASGNGNMGTLLNSPIWTTGVKGTALSFDGAGDYVDMGNSPSVNISGTAITVHAWVKGTSPGNYKYIVSKTNATNVGYALYTGSMGTLRFYVGIGGGLMITPDVPSPWDDIWHHVVGVYDGGSLRLYIDGVERASVAATGNIADSSARSLNIGRFSEGGNLLKGAIDDVQIYNRALSPTEIQQLYNEVPVLPSPPINLIVTK